MDQLNIFDLLYPKYKIKKPVRLIELFGGIGSQAKALEKLQKEFEFELEHYKLVEFDRFAINSYNVIHKTQFQTSNIKKISAKDLDIVETDKYDYIMTYSFPCQDLSNSGRRAGMSKGSDTRSGLLWEVERILDELIESKCNLPQILMLENVTQIANDQNIKDFSEWQNKLESIGYKNYVSFLDIKEYGIPQGRNRCFMISILGDYSYSFPKPFELKLKLKDMLESEFDKKYILSEQRVEWMKQTKFNISSFSRTVMDVDGVSKTLMRCFEGSPLCVAAGSRIRKLTPLECFRLMGFDDIDYHNASKVNSDSQLYKQIGNSIGVNVLYYIFKEFFDVKKQVEVKEATAMYKNEATEIILTTYSKYRDKQMKQIELIKVLDGYVDIDQVYAEFEKLHIIIYLSSLVYFFKKQDRKLLDLFESISFKIMKSLGLYTDLNSYQKMIDKYLDEENDQRCLLVFAFENRDLEFYEDKEYLSQYIDVLKNQMELIEDFDDRCAEFKLYEKLEKFPWDKWNKMRSNNEY